VTRAEIQAFFPSTPIKFGAASYHVPTLAWLQGALYDTLRNRLGSDGLSAWTVRWECRDFARYYAALAMECWAITKDASQDDALAIGEFWYQPTLGTGHAINACLTDQGLIFIDPQNNQACQLTAEQLSSCYFLRF
jgi:hypothetical protein